MRKPQLELPMQREKTLALAPPAFTNNLTMADEEDNLVDYEEEALDEKGEDAGDEKEIKKYV